MFAHFESDVLGADRRGDVGGGAASFICAIQKTPGCARVRRIALRDRMDARIRIAGMRLRQARRSRARATSDRRRSLRSAPRSPRRPNRVPDRARTTRPRVACAYARLGARGEHARRRRIGVIGDRGECKLIVRVRSVLSIQPPDSIATLSAWNDAFDAADVVRALHRAGRARTRERHPFAHARRAHRPSACRRPAAADRRWCRSLVAIVEIAPAAAVTVIVAEDSSTARPHPSPSARSMRPSRPPACTRASRLDSAPRPRPRAPRLPCSVAARMRVSSRFLLLVELFLDRVDRVVVVHHVTACAATLSSRRSSSPGDRAAAPHPNRRRSEDPATSLHASAGVFACAYSADQLVVGAGDAERMQRLDAQILRQLRVAGDCGERHRHCRRRRAPG